MTLEMLELNLGTFNTLKRAGFNTVEEVLALELDALMNKRQMGVEALRNFIRRCFINFIKPRWCEAACIRFDYEVSTEKELENRNFRPLAGPYSRSEKWMMERAVADLQRGCIEWDVSCDPESSLYHLWRLGGVEIESE